MRRNIFALLFLSSAAWAADTLSAADPARPGIEAAQTQIRNHPGDSDPYLRLAAEWCRKARDSQDVRYYDRAATEVDRVLKMSPGLFEARKLQVTILLGRNDLSAALKLAAELNRKIPDDLDLWGLLAEINGALGNYKEALRDAQWVLDLRPGSTLGFIEAARLREAYGDPEGAKEFFQEAERRTPPGDVEQRAWLLAQIGLQSLSLGDLKGAALKLDESWKANPESQVAAAALAKLRLRQGDAESAVSLLERRYKTVEDARTLYDYADALARAGHPEQAASAFREFEARAKAEQDKPHNANLQLILYYADGSGKEDAAAALALAGRELASRQDSATLDAAAWAAYANGRWDEAKLRTDGALAAGFRDPGYFCHASRIAAKLGDADGAAKFEKEARSLDPSSCGTAPK